MASPAVLLRRAAPISDPQTSRIRPATREDSDTVGRRLLRITAVLAIAAAAAVTVGGIANHFLLGNRIADLDPELELSLNNWVTVVASFTGALAAALHALILPARRQWFGVLAVIFAFLSLDDLVRLHERIGESVGLFENVETVLFMPVFGAALLIVWALAREASGDAGRFLRVGLILLVAAVLVDLGSTITHALERAGIAWPQPTRVAIEEGLEVSGWILVSGALVAAVCVALLDAPRRPPGPDHAA